MVKDKLIVALDFHTKEDALALVDKLGDSVVFYKVGMELFYRVGSSIIEELKKRNKKIFLDLKLHDIPNTVMFTFISRCRHYECSCFRWIHYDENSSRYSAC